MEDFSSRFIHTSRKYNTAQWCVCAANRRIRVAEAKEGEEKEI
jgi:hypothetical protein